MSNRPALGRGSSWFDGPGARPILGESGPSTAATHASPRHDDPSYGGSTGGGEGYESHQPRVVGSGSSGAPQPSHSAPAQPVIRRVGNKANVSSACGPCKRAHLACDPARPCKRCVNIGKEDQCEDVPHKKRGRPKVNKTPSIDPYARPVPRPAPPPSASVEDRKWRPSSGYDSPYTTTSPPVQLGALAPRMPSPPPRAPMVGPPGPYESASASPYSAPPSGPASAPPTAHSSAHGQYDDRPQPTFTLFCSTDLKILRATADCYRFLGFHAHELLNLDLLRWIHPADQHLINQDRDQLLNVSYLPTSPHTSRETHVAIVTANEHELKSPAAGMVDPYPNQTVRMFHGDGGLYPFNIRMHLGGGLGGSLWQQETLGRIYLVVSCLPVPSEAVHDPQGRRPSQYPAGAAPPPTAGGLPSFSSIAAAADAPGSSTYHRPLSAHGPGGSYYSRPSTSSSAPYPPGPTGPSLSPRAPSPGGPGAYSRYHSYPPPHPHPGGFYMPPGSSSYDRRPDTHPDEWRRHGQPLPSPSAPGSAPPLPDYRRGWDRQ
ncbi:hypothetical protein CC85DRAFT_87841 [Cutaneotrichosporon oleaginosum]|uniref:Transcription activator of gluconeogenesis ERT1 n=1 Tax=Cutaneotrichosporon oleaginosum TaxID=879819 RepID=A0A0J0XXV0_9TREE|nr:uncharacterized protein CC85DRAFT_87841 [Cutaneotrichosporon oleaginosum]KLT45883.1 hypothetical protein CC85DRAFT_87841 [Cutaneotrichosporon oleaginosum]TXT06584.1 hypothetical protein COLE_05915 [Cutaneotrichosporon oleaginosum]